ncbi:MAG: hypothetical protein PHT02_14645 [Tissierellia bacterium]|nr:hypothetical protein [Tissierellia bacterium]
MQTIELNKRVASIEVADDKIIINLEQKYIPQDGEYFYVKTKTNSEFIGIKRKGEYITSRYYSYDIKYSAICSGEGRVSNDNLIEEIRPATKEERELLNKALEARGKKWNPETKQIEELPKIGDFCIFWGYDKRMAKCGVLRRIDSHNHYPYSMHYGVYYKNCIPFQSVEHFKGFINET